MLIKGKIADITIRPHKLNRTNYINDQRYNYYHLYDQHLVSKLDIYCIFLRKSRIGLTSLWIELKPESSCWKSYNYQQTKKSMIVTKKSKKKWKVMLWNAALGCTGYSITFWRHSTIKPHLLSSLTRKSISQATIFKVYYSVQKIKVSNLCRCMKSYSASFAKLPIWLIF